MAVRIVRHVILAEEVDADHPVVAAVREGLPVDRSLLPVTLLGRDPSAITGSVWFIEADGRSTEICLDRG
jgi:hypothetical protein